MAFDMVQVASAAVLHRQGFSKVCHAGLLEVVVPWFADGRLAWVLFAGPLRPQPGAALLRDPADLPAGGPWVQLVAKAESADARRAATYLELARQLAARLAAIQAAQTGLADGGTGTRADEIRRFIRDEHTRAVGIADLARRLGLSASRAGHAVRESCGRTFRELLIDARLRTAAGLLRHSGLGVPEVARRAGFANLSYFHRCFRRHFRLTPRRYRLQAEGPAGQSG
jgi:AraC-like DNA-binding protein